MVASTGYSVIIYGESGAGKEGVARIIHEKSSRKSGPFVAMDCGAISRDLAGSELFGHEKGAFTGAHSQKTGHFEMADGGTLFLDEIGNLPYEVQTLLLRVLQEKTLRRLGSTREREIDVRIIVASNERLTESTKQGKFREDLYHRLNEFDIEILPLRERKTDIVFFANHFLKEISKELNKNIDGFEPQVIDVFMNYPWPGNIRELKNVVRRAALIENKNNVGLKVLPFEILKYARINPDDSPISEPEYSKAVQNLDMEPGDPSENGRAEFSKPRLKKAALEAEYGMILSALNKVNFNKSKAARILNIDRKTLYNKMKQMKLLSK
jgi:two-component system response regulator HydG